MKPILVIDNSVEVLEKQNSIYALLLTTLLAIGGLFDLFSKFFSSSATLSPTSLKWVGVIVFYLLVLTLNILLCLPTIKRRLITISLVQSKKFFDSIRPWKYGLVALIIAVWGFLLLFTPANRFFNFNLNAFFLNFSICLLITIQVSYLTQKNFLFQIGKKEILVSFFLYAAYYVIGLNLIFYQAMTLVLILLTSIIVCFVYSDVSVTSILQWVREVNARFNIVFSAYLILFAFSLFYFFTRSINGAFTLPSIMDEGSYALKGILFTAGKYIPYQDFGPWTNKMPLAFMIPGWIQQIFGYGIETIRISSLVMQIIVIILLYFLGERYRKPYGGMIAVILFALNPALQNFYSLGNSQVLSIFLLSLSLFFTLGEKRTMLELVIGNILAAILMLSRENMAPYYLFLNLFLIWKHGLKKALFPILSGIFVMLIGHWAFWPGILKVWAKWVPSTYSPFLDPYRYFGGGKVMWRVPGKVPELLTILTSFVQGISSNTIALLAIVGVPLLLKKWGKIKTDPSFKEYVFLFTTLLVLNIAHGFITLNDGSCLYCFSSYLAFYLPMGILFFVLSLNLIDSISTGWKAGLFSGIGLVFYAGYWFNHRQSLKDLLYLKLPSATSESGFQAIFISIEQLFKIKPDQSQIYFPIFLGLIVYVMLISLLFFCFYNKSKTVPHFNFYSFLLVFVVALTLLTGLWMNSNSGNQYCKKNVIAAHRTVDQELKVILPAGSKIYWLGESTTPFLTLNVELFPQQINDGFSYKKGSQDDAAEKYGFWNANLAKKWSEEADYLMIEKRYMSNPILENVDLATFQNIATTSPLDPCESSSRYLIFQKIN